MSRARQIPNGWENKSVGELFILDNGVTPIGFRPRDLSGPVLVYGANGPIGSSNGDNYGPGYLVGRVGAAGSITCAAGRIWASDNTLTATPRIERCDYRFAEHLLRFLNLARLAIMTAQPLITQGNLANLTSHVPTDVSEQSRIATVLDTVDEAIKRTEAVIAKLKQVRAGLLHDLLTRGLDEHGQLRDPIAHPEQFQDSPLGRIPSEWEVTVVAAAGEVRLGRQRSPAHEAGQHMRPYLRVANVFDGFIDYSDTLWMNFEPEEQELYGLRPGDILLNEGQSLELVGRSAVYLGPAGVYCFQNTLLRFRCNALAIPEFCQAVFKHWLATRRFVPVAKQTTSVAHLGADRFARMPFVRPNLDEQRRITQALTLQAEQQRVEEMNLAKLQQLKSGLMTDLLTGRVSVPETIAEVAP